MGVSKKTAEDEGEVLKRFKNGSKIGFKWIIQQSRVQTLEIFLSKYFSHFYVKLNVPCNKRGEGERFMPDLRA